MLNTVPKRFAILALLAILAPLGGGCAVITAVDTAASVTGTVVETGVDIATAPVDLLVGDDDDDEKSEDDE